MKKHTTQPKPFQNRLSMASVLSFLNQPLGEKQNENSLITCIFYCLISEILCFDYFQDGPVLGCCHWLTYRFKPSDKNASWSDNKAWAPLKSASNFPAERQACGSCPERAGAAGTHALSLGERLVCNLSTPLHLQSDPMRLLSENVSSPFWPLFCVAAD